MKRKIFSLLLSLSLVLGVFAYDAPAVHAAEVSTILGDANYVNPGWMNHRMYITGLGINCSLGIGEMSTYGVKIKQNNGVPICELQNTSLVDIFIGNINHDLAAIPVVSHNETFRQGTTYVAADSAKYYQLGPNAKNWILGILQSKLMGNPEDIHVALTMDQVVPVSGGSPLSYSADYVVSGSCTTSYKTSGANRSTNVELAASRMNIVIMPGQAVSVSDTILPRTAENGYKVAHAYQNGQIVDAMGGGICQVSSTIYNACRNSGLEILERHPHSMPVAYLPLGMDAAISAGTKDLVFRNPYSTPVIMQASTSEKRLTVNVLVPVSVLNGTTYKFWAEKTGPLSATSYVTTYVNGVEQSTVNVGSSKYRALPAE